jgi:hypothetical protein
MGEPSSKAKYDMLSDRESTVRESLKRFAIGIVKKR